MLQKQTSGVIIQGSSRSQGNTSKMVQHLHLLTRFDVIDLKTKHIEYFDYAHRNADDDFIPLMKNLVVRYDIMVFASPVYWYTMSAEMKTFFDRLSDLLKTEKDTGRKLRGKSMAVLSCSGHDDVPSAFFEPFQLSANYLGMHYLGDIHTWVESSGIPSVVLDQLHLFANSLVSLPSD